MDRPPRSWPALDIRLADSPANPASLDLLLAALDDYRPTAVADDVGGGVALRVFFAEAADREAAVRRIAPLVAPGTGSVRPVDVDDEGWAERSQRALEPVTVGRFWIAPPWHARAQPADVLPIIVNPSMGFGTGHHASTRLCLRALQAIEVAGRRVIDLGTGSGILAIAAIRLGAGRVVAVDSDLDAIQSACENVALNRVVSQVELLVGDLRTLPVESADVVLANLTGPLLAGSSDAVQGLCRPGGCLVLAGFLTDEADRIAAAFAPARVERREVEDEWGALVVRRL